VGEKTTWPWGVKGWYMVDGNGLIQQRRLSDREKADVVALAAACNAHEGLELKLNVDTPPDDDDAGGNDFLYYKDGTLAGYCALDIGSGVELCGMAHPAHRRRGIGRALLIAATAELRRRGVGKLLLICERNSRTGQAFVAATTAQYRFGESRMRLDLATFHSASPPDARLSVREAGREDIEPLTRTVSNATCATGTAGSIWRDWTESPSGRSASSTPDPPPTSTPSACCRPTVGAASAGAS